LRNTLLVALVVLLLLVPVSCGQRSDSSDKKGPVTVATFIDTEGAVLGKMIVMLLEQNGFQVVDKTEFGTPDVLRKALLSSELDLVIDYTGSGQFYHASDDDDIWSDPQKGYETIKKLDREKNNLVWLEPANANNTEVIATSRDFAVKNSLKTMYDFAGYVNRDGDVKLICSASFAESIRGLAGYEAAYGFKLRNDQLIILSAGNTAEMLKALVESTNNVNFSLAYGTDGALDQMNLVVLDDPKSIPPVYLPTPVLRGELHQQYPEIEAALKPLFQSFTLESLQQLNAKVAFEGQDARSVAAEYLEVNGFLNK
jgi:osmoprotectant transport system substrate-binding protein